MDTPLLGEDRLADLPATPARPARRGLGLSREDSYLASRPDYFANLRRGSVPNLHLDVADGDDERAVFGIGDLVEGSPTQKRSGSAMASLTAFPREDAGDGGVAVSELRQRLSVRRMSETALGMAEEVQVRVTLKDYSYHVPTREDAPSIKTVFNQSPCYAASSFLVNVGELITGSRKIRDMCGHYEKKWILKDVNLVLKPGTTYLVMGPPGCGKTSLLKAVAGRLKKKHGMGRIEYNGVSTEDAPDMVIQNIVSYVAQLDNHAPFLTVQETFDFAANCRLGHKKTKVADSTQQYLSENLTIDGLDLAVCRETYVGDANNRGVSGGQRRRVTVGEMMVGQNPVACADEISTGLDAAVTYDIANSIVKFAKAAGTTRLVSLLQPGPETFSLFDEVILLAEGQVIYCGPIDDVVEYFGGLGYRPPNTMDVADFLQSVATPDGMLMFDADRSPLDSHYTSEQFAEAFRESERYRSILIEQEMPLEVDWSSKVETVDEESPEGQSRGNIPTAVKKQFANPFWTSVGLNVRRNMTLLKRDKEFLIGKCIENFGMGIGMALIFLQSAQFPSTLNTSDIIAGWVNTGCRQEDFTDDVANSLFRLMSGTYSSIFLTSFHILLGTLTSTPDEVDQRAIYYKHADARFFQTGAFFIAKQFSQLPLLALEIIAFGLPFYFIAGLAYTARAFFTYLLILIVYKFALRILYGILVQFLAKKANVQGIGTFLYLMLTLTGGFVVIPLAIPAWFKWVTYINPMFWAMQAMASNQYLSSKYEGFNCIVEGDNLNLGKLQLDALGWNSDGREWIGYAIAILLGFISFFGIITWLALEYVRLEPERPDLKKGVSIGKTHQTAEFSIPFVPVDLSFDKLSYTVTASTSKDKLRLLNEVSGVFQAGRMCALMGSSGAGKTTLMDVIAMRKTSGTITGEIELNGFDQERTSFLRSSGYVEQFDVQQPELTVRETVAYSARLRLDANSPAIDNDDTKMMFVDHVLEIMELTDIETLQVGSFEEGGLSFEQRKRLAIACELAGSPSVIFLDEPTSGLDSRGALVVIRAMRRIADSGRTVVATIHQPSAAVFNLFDDLILLKKGGNVVFFGELGDESQKLVQYFEARGANPIGKGENPAAWVLRAYAGDHASNETDWAEEYKQSDQFSQIQDQIKSIRVSKDGAKRITFVSEFATPFGERVKLTVARMLAVYRRSAPYNMTRMVVAILYAFLLGATFIGTSFRRKTAWEEYEAAAIIGTVFLSLNVIGTMSINMGVPMAKRIRDVFYKHRASGMLGHSAAWIGLVTAELPYLFIVSVVFVLVYCLVADFFTNGSGFFWFCLFFFLHTSSYSFFAQCFMCLVRDEKAVGALQGVWIGLNLFYAGFVIVPQAGARFHSCCNTSR